MAGETDAEKCNLCPVILEAHCELHGNEQPTFCDLWDRYQRDPDYGPDDVLYDLSKIATPAQVSEVQAHVGAREKVRAGAAPPA